MTEEKSFFEKIMTADEVFVDPPSGWMYGFPALWSRKEYPKVEDFLRAKGYPEDQIEFASSYLRMWLPPEGEK